MKPLLIRFAWVAFEILKANLGFTFLSIPIWWRLIDCSFGVFGFIPLWLYRLWAIELEREGENR